VRSADEMLVAVIVDDRVTVRSPDGRVPPAKLHEARRSAKRARYAVEVFALAAGKPAARLVARLKEVQDLLGIHQDTVVAREVLPSGGGRRAGRREERVHVRAAARPAGRGGRERTGQAPGRPGTGESGGERWLS
jgi:CHAD domain-containing protein